ncbi:murein biosynthesis integral membrane protein MurJ [Streptomyces abyssomicinicus]|uniref:murein biosynthesis integral membrane protein MurJ n=1 Tax=Streptomyces abyssomicinicus TaxID=574929 RepID=UPI00124F81A3|nr:murein biosynthesis integral membrane protein MurJ [Streptomyces abyssomicinicus]
MNAPYDGDRGRSAGGSGHPGMPPTEHGQVPPQPPTDMYHQDAYDQDPYPGPDHRGPGHREQDLSQEPVGEAFYDGAMHPPAAPGPQDPYGHTRPQEPPRGPDPRVWAPAPGQGPGGPVDGRTTPYVGIDELVTGAASADRSPDAFANLYRDQQPNGPRPPADPAAGPALPPVGVPGPAQAPVVPGVPPGPAGPPQAFPQPPGTPAAGPEPAPTAKKGGRASNVLKSSAMMAAGTLVSRLTGFVRSMLIVAALGTATLGDAFQVAYQLPTMIYILTVGGGLNSVFVPQLVRAMKQDEDGGEAYANRLLTLVMVALAALTALAMLGAPLLVRALSSSIADEPAANDVAVTFTLYFLPTIFFMGIHVVMGQILNARNRFGAMMWTPVLNNIVIIVTLGMFLWVYGTAADSKMQVQSIPPEGVRLLGIGVLLGLVVQALAMIPYLRESGFKLRLRFDWRGHGMGKAAKLAKWTILFVLANQLGAVVVSQLATAALLDGESIPGTGFSAYANAQLIWGLPQAIITVSLMAALLPRLARSAAEDDAGAVRDDISQGLRTTAVAIVPIAFGFLALGVPMCNLMFGGSGTSAATNMGYMLMAFGLGLIPYSVQYVVLRAFYAYEDTRTPFYNTVIVAAGNAGASFLCFLLLPARWAVVGMAASYGLAYGIGVGVAWRRLRKKLGGDLDGSRVLRTYARLCIASVPAAALSGAVSYGIGRTLGWTILGSLSALVLGGIVLLGVFFLAARRMRVEELNSLVGMVRGRLGR